MMRLVTFLLCLPLLLGGCTLPVVLSETTGPRPDELVFPPLEFRFPEVQKVQLDNGMRVYLYEDHELPLVSLSLMVEGGDINDPLEKTGLSELFATTMETGGTKSLSPENLENELEAKAINLSVSASTYAYELGLSLHRNDLERGLDIMTELVRSPRFAEDRFELARKQMVEGLLRMNDDPGSIAVRLLAEAVNPGHPFGTTPTVEQVKSISREDLFDLHQHYFQPANFYLAISGDITEADLMTLLDKEFSGWGGAEPLVRDYPALPDQQDGKILLAFKDIPQTTILMGHRGIDKDNPDLFALRLADFILGSGGLNSRLMREIRSNRGLAYSVYSYFRVGRQLPGSFIAGSETKSGSTVEVVRLMREMMQQIIAEPVSPAELELAKKSLINSFVFAFENSHSVVNRVMDHDFYGYPPDYMSTYRDKVAAVTVEDVQQAARKYLHPDKLQIVLVGDSRVYADEINSLGLPVEMVDLEQLR
ncbi:MAG: insulinase family protein [Desulfuromonas sp.]|nr:MAG: insulinase family protein [Desulfuromonas sp.]